MKSVEKDIRFMAHLFEIRTKLQIVFHVNRIVSEMEHIDQEALALLSTQTCKPGYPVSL